MWTMLALLSCLPQVDEPQPLPPLPAACQTRWQQVGCYAVVHLGLPTFGAEGDPAGFAPAELECRQWAKVCADAGIGGIVLAAIDATGFCLWPSDIAARSTRQIPWRRGEADLVAELAAACRDRGLRFGLEMGSAAAPASDLADLLAEAAARAGDVFLVRFQVRPDAAAWSRCVAAVRRHLPGACIASDAGPDVRFADGAGSGTPVEHPLPLRPSPYYRAGDDQRLATLPELYAAWSATVDCGQGLSIGLAIDTDGRVPARDAARLRELRQAVAATFGDDLARGGTVEASAVRGNDARFAPEHLTDGDQNTYWAADDGNAIAALTVELRAAAAFNRVVLAEPAHLGRRIRRFAIEALVDGGWRHLASGAGIGPRLALATPGVRGKAIRVLVQEAVACPALAAVEVHCAPPQATVAGPAEFLDTALVRLAADLPGATIRYRLDGRPVDRSSPVYTEPIRLQRSAALQAVASLDGRASLWPARATFRRFTAADLAAAVHFLVPPEPGLRFEYHAGEVAAIDALAGHEPTAVGIVSGLTLQPEWRGDRFAVRLTGHLLVPRDGVYTFTVAASGAARLWLHERVVADAPASTARSGVAALAAGYHPLQLTVLHEGGTPRLEVTWANAELAAEPIPAPALAQ